MEHYYSAFKQRNTYLNVIKKLAPLPRILKEDPVLLDKLEQSGLDICGLLVTLDIALKLRSDIIELYGKDRS